MFSIWRTTRERRDFHHEFTTLRFAVFRTRDVGRPHRVRAGVSGHSDEGDDAGAVEVGVGPWVGPWPYGEQWDTDRWREGDRRNVADRYRYWRTDAVVADLDASRHTFHVAIENWGHDFNIGSVVRTANAFNAAAFHIVGQAPLEPARCDGHRPLPARAPPPHRR